MRLLMVGAGNITQSEHLPNWRQIPGVEVVGLVDQRPLVAQAVGEAYGLAWFDDFGQACDRLAVDVVHIATNLASHLPLALQAIQAGYHVLIEKPLAERSDQAQSMIAAAQAARVVLAVGYQKQTDADVAYLTELIRSGRLGALLGLHSVFRISQPPLYRRLTDQPRLPFLPNQSTAEDDLHQRLLDQSIHHLNLFNTWLPQGLRVVSVCRGGPLWALTAQSGDGQVAPTHLNAAQAGHGEEFWAYFEGGSVHVQIWSPHFPATCGRVEVMESGGDRLYQPLVPRRNPYLAMVERFIAQVRAEQPWLEDASRAVDDLALVAQIEAWWRSASAVAQ
jgi:predicted dehydrogenase